MIDLALRIIILAPALAGLLGVFAIVREDPREPMAWALTLLLALTSLGLLLLALA